MADIWNNEQRGIAIAVFSSVNFIGPVGEFTVNLSTLLC